MKLEAQTPAIDRNGSSRDFLPGRRGDWAALQAVPLRAAVYVSIPGTTLRSIANLRPGQVLETSWPVTDDVPLRVGDTMLGWAEFDNLDGRMAVRLTKFVS